MTTTDHAAELRQALKKHNLTSRDVSVRSESFSMGSALRITIKNADVDGAFVERLASEHESIRRCQHTGDVLSGGNRYVSVRYTQETLDEFERRNIDVVKAAAEKLENEIPSALIDIAGTEFLLGRGCNGFGFSVWDHTCHRAEAFNLQEAARWIAVHKPR